MIPTALDLRRLRHIPIERILAARGHPLTPRGHRLLGCCPVHGGDNPRAFVVDPARNLWYCFTRCGRGGDVVDLVRALDSCDHAHAARRLAMIGGADLPRRTDPVPATPAARWQPYTRTLTLDPCDPLLRAKGIDIDTARRFEVGRYHGRGFLAGCLGVRLHDHQGSPIGYAGRRTEPGAVDRHGKWKLPRGLPKSRILYNLHRVRDLLAQRGVVLVECPWAVLRLAQIEAPAVALLGTHLSQDQARLLQPAARVILMLDGDPAGRQATRRIASRLGSRARPVSLPDGLDPDDLSDSCLRDALGGSLLP